MVSFCLLGCSQFNSVINLKRIQLLQDNSQGVDGLNNARLARFTPDFSQVLVISADDDSLTTFELDKKLKLTFIEIHQNDDDISGMRGATKFVISADGNRLFLVSFYDSALVVFNKNSEGYFQYQQTISDYVKWFTEDGDPLPVPEESDKLGILGAYDIVMTPDNQQLLVAGSASNSLSIFDLGSQGEITSSQIIRDSQIQNYGLKSAVSVNASHDNNYVFVASYEEHAITVFTRSKTGKLTFNQTLRNNQNGIHQMVNPHSLASSTDSQFLYVACDGAVVVFRKVDGEYTFFQTVSNDDEGISGLSGAVGITLTPDNKYVFVASEKDGALVVFSQESSGILQFVSIIQEPEIEGASSVIVSPDGEYLLLTAGDEGNSLSLYEITR